MADMRVLRSNPLPLREGTGGDLPPAGGKKSPRRRRTHLCADARRRPLPLPPPARGGGFVQGEGPCSVRGRGLLDEASGDVVAVVVFRLGDLALLGQELRRLEDGLGGAAA